MRFWIWFNVTVTLALFTATLVFLVRRALREGRLTAELALFLATLTLGWMEAVIDWGGFVYYSPDWPHFPESWPVVRLIPVLPLHIPLCYTWFFWGGSVMGRGLARWVLVRRPGLPIGATLLAAGLFVGFAFDAVVENFFIVVGGAWNYTQVWGPLALRGGTDTQWPVYMGFAMGLTISPLTYLLGKRNDRGEDLLAAWLGRARERSRSSGSGTAGAATRRQVGWARYLVAWIIVVHVIYGAVSLGYAVLRWSGVQTTVGTVQPYPNGPAWYDDDVTEPGDPSVNTEPTQKSVDDGVPDENVPPKVG
ncbi:MAG: spirocyclase AveC family protein [Acidimicrobiia bacterium]